MHLIHCFYGNIGTLSTPELFTTYQGTRLRSLYKQGGFFIKMKELPSEIKEKDIVFYGYKILFDSNS